MKLIYLIALLSLSACIFTKPSDVDKFAIQEGWQEAKYDGYSFFACSKNDWYHTSFVAKKNGKEIKGTICRGLFFKGATLRYE